MRYLLDTPLIAATVRAEPSPALLKWMGQRRDDELFITALTLAEIRRGILERLAGHRRNELEAWFNGPEGPAALFAGRILPFDERAAPIWARLMVEAKLTGKARNPLDMLVAAIAGAHNCLIVTDNPGAFPGIDVLNPLTAFA